MSAVQRKNLISDDGAKALGEALMVNSCLRELDLVSLFCFFLLCRFCACVVARSQGG
jgi:hypothetical protein